MPESRTSRDARNGAPKAARTSDDPKLTRLTPRPPSWARENVAPESPMTTLPPPHPVRPPLVQRDRPRDQRTDTARGPREDLPRPCQVADQPLVVRLRRLHIRRTDARRPARGRPFRDRLLRVGSRHGRVSRDAGRAAGAGPRGRAHGVRPPRKRWNTHRSLRSARQSSTLPRSACGGRWRSATPLCNRSPA